MRRVRYIKTNSTVKILKCRVTTIGGRKIGKADTSGKDRHNDTTGAGK